MLIIKRPTPTTVLYTVSTRSQSKSLTSSLSTALSLVIRISSGLLVIILLLQEYRLLSTLGNNNFSTIPAGQSTTFQRLETILLLSPPGRVASFLPHILTFPWRLLLISGIIWLIFRKGYTEESILVIRGLGVQTTTSSRNYLFSGGEGASSTRFIPTRAIQDIFIHEAFRGFAVRYYLGIVVEGEEVVVVVFPSILPRREILEQVWRGARACLYEPKS